MCAKTAFLILILFALLLFAGCDPLSKPGPPRVLIYSFGGHTWNYSIEPPTTPALERLNRAHSLYEAERWDDSARCLTALFDHAEHGAEARCLAGVICVRQRDFPAAERHIRAAIKANPKRRWHHVSLIYALTEAGRFSDAEREALALCDQYSEESFWNALHAVRQARADADFNDRLWRALAGVGLVLVLIVGLLMLINYAQRMQ